MDFLFILEFLVAFLIRLWLCLSDYKQVISDRVEISTPLNSWKRVTEGVVLYEEGTDPYIGDMFHETPIALIAFHWMIHNIPRWLNIVFITCDLLSAFLLYKAAKQCMKLLMDRQTREKAGYAEEVEKLLLTEQELSSAPMYVLAAYLFNPYTILSCAAHTTTVFANLGLAVFFCSMLHGHLLVCGFSLALATLQSLYPASLIVPAALLAAQSGGARSSASARVALLIVAFVVPLVGLLGACYHISGSWHFLHSTYGFILNIPDLRPNVGLFWYFFTEMFEHFRPLFICAFQLNASLLYVSPLALRLYKEPPLLAASLTALSAIFRSYPSIGDVGFYLALLPMWKHLFHYMQQGFVVGCFFLVTSVLAPVLWHLWIYCRSANANFYFGVTLAFATAQIFLITDILFAYIKREFALKNGLQRTIDGEEAKLILE
ncbi:phosphatidylinositol glycan anchor biosynthesis class U protein-like [Macrosteles quadrilineatus]|uniref:phosphatidylinositol glycan anchor biosynthesis class U protein-like n=1 Tax=Macrosteles quadrilineatus TaxID=74068 RepID=UPI0023E34B4E|nr:phosphatidylinositol glycan anchor biosynthesis class U protein-like [Macrosteles quadrilineatus]